MVTSSHSSLGGVLINKLPIPLYIKIILMFVSHFLLDLFNEYYYTPDEPKWYNSLFILGELFIFSIFFYWLFFISKYSLFIKLIILIVPNIVDIIESIYKGITFIKNVFILGGFTIENIKEEISNIPHYHSFWTCHYGGFFPIHWEDSIYSKFPFNIKINLFITLFVDLIIVMFIIIIN